VELTDEKEAQRFFEKLETWQDWEPAFCLGLQYAGELPQQYHMTSRVTVVCRAEESSVSPTLDVFMLKHSDRAVSLSPQFCPESMTAAT
jgi:hypothetical protein